MRHSGKVVSGDFSLHSQSCSVDALGELAVLFSVPGIVTKVGSYNVPETVQVWENPAMSRVLGINVTTTVYAPCCQWSGYGVQYISGGSAQAVYDTDSYFYQPSVSSNSQCYASSPYTCDLGIWTGMSQNAGGGGFLVQSGTAGTITCTSGGSCGSATYDAWWDWLYSGGSTLGTCSTSSYPVSTGDYMLALEEWGPYWGGSSSQYEAFVNDYTANNGAGWGCASGVLSQSGTAYWSQTIAEIPTLSGGTAALPTFSSVTAIYPAICDSTTSCQFYYTPFHNGNDNTYVMDNCGSPYNLALSTPNSITGDFTWTYQNSCGT